MPTQLTIDVPHRGPEAFSLTHAVCSYGYYALAPNVWDAEQAELRRPLRDSTGGVVQVRIRQSPDRRSVRVHCDRTTDRADHAPLRSQVRRMLRLGETFRDWTRLHRPAARARFGRLFRSPTLFEDIVKTMTCCNIAWSGTKLMNRLMCEHIGSDGDFPTPAELAAVSPKQLAARCKVGYRAERIVRFARHVRDGAIDLSWFEQPDRTTEQLYEALRGIYGIGDYAAGNILQHLGRYDRMAIDSETIRHFRDRHGVTGEPSQVAAVAARHYDGFAPYQFLAYWFELWGDPMKWNGREL